MPDEALPEAWAATAPTPAREPGELPAMELEHSKAIARLRYHPEARTLTVEFRNGSVYRYFGVSRDDYTKLATSASPGARFNADIAPYHENERLA
ncbi:MAG: KTSC domain-containing protein [Thermoplasmatota archaeon]|nr:KTSC domain-containing protein [Halobacteriales archaeon]